MNDRNLSNLALTIIEIINQQYNVHVLVVKGQIQDMMKITGKKLDNSEFKDAITHLEAIKFIQRLSTNSDVLILTEEGKKFLQSNI